MRRGDRESAMAEQKKDGGKGRNGEGRRGSTMSCELRRQITRHVIGEFRSEYLLAALGKHQESVQRWDEVCEREAGRVLQKFTQPGWLAWQGSPKID